MANVVHCDLLQVGNHTYRLRTQSIGGKHQHQHHYDRGEAAEQDRAAYIEEAEQENEAELIDESLITQEGNSFVTRISIDPQLLPFVIGKEGHKKKEIESATGATLLIPRSSKQRQQPQTSSSAAAAADVVVGSSRSETITIKAPSKAALSSARIRTELVINSAINGRLLDYTHFVSLPLSNEQTAAKLNAFQQQVLSDTGAADKGLHSSIFINPKTLHLTLLMLKLYSDEARHTARQVLLGLKPQVESLLGGQPLVLQLSGLDHMSDDPTDMHVLYLKVQEQGPQQVLPELCDLVVRHFKEAGLLVPGQLETVKLHATIINTRHRRGDPKHSNSAAAAAATAAGGGKGGRAAAGGGGRTQHRDRVGFDGRRLLGEFGGLDLGAYLVPAVHISERGAYDASGYYRCFEKLQLPSK